MLEHKDFSIQLECNYKNNRFEVRDNGAVFRYPKDENRIRPYDLKWTFGKLNSNGYLVISSVSIHKIVAIAFHGEPPTNQHVVDHIDTNRQNNRPENLRWLTKLENILLNPITRKRIELACECTIFQFLSDPSKYKHKFKDSNYAWMGLVSSQEAQRSYQRLLQWAKSGQIHNSRSLDSWIYEERDQKNIKKENSELSTSLTLNALQKNWSTPTEFPFCPKVMSNESIEIYTANLKSETIFCKNKYSNSIIIDLFFNKDKNNLVVMCISSEENAIKPYSLAEITSGSNCIIHNNLGSFFKKEDAEKHFTLLQGLEWTGGETFEDYC